MTSAVGATKMGHSEGETSRKRLDGPELGEFLLTRGFRKGARGARWGLSGDLDVTCGELGAQICVVDELAMGEERAVHPAEESVDAAVLVAAAGRGISTRTPMSTMACAKGR
jgi:hypothetical protein